MAVPARPRRFRRRLIAAFVLVAALTGGILAITTYIMIRQHRHASFTRQAEAQARLSLLSAPRELTLPGFESLLAEYQSRGGFDTVAVSGKLVFSSSPEFSLVDVPDPAATSSDGLIRGDVSVEGEPYLVLGGNPADSTARLYFFFSRAELRSGVAEVGYVLSASWLLSVLVAAVIGERVARRTLRPVRSAAEASQSLAEGLLHTRLGPLGDDEFGAWANSFNHMAEALEDKLHELEEAAASEQRFTADVAHELRTPLTGMTSAASLLEAEMNSIGPAGRRPAQILIDEARRLQLLIAELLELARLDRGGEEVQLEPLHLDQAIAAVIGRRNGIGPRDGDSPIATEVDDELYVMADRIRFNRVLGNLVDNAVHHGSAPLCVVARTEGAQAVIEVLDSGPGIDGTDLPHLFERFFKADTARACGGSGLGLSIALANARLQHGDVEAANREDGGARFTFRLPRCPGPDHCGSDSSSERGVRALGSSPGKMSKK